MKTPSKILIINIFGIGDVLFSTPLISNLRKNYPNVKIGYVCNRRSAPVLQSNPKVDHLYIYERDEFYQIYKKSVFQFLMKLRSFLNEIKKERYDLVLDISLNTNINILCWLCGIKERVGLNYKNRSRFLTKKVNIKGFEGKHVIEYYLTLLDIIGCNIFERKMELFINQENKQVVDKMLNSKGLDKSKKLVGIVAGGGASWGKEAYSRRWSCEKFAKLADKLIENYQVQIILIGDKTEVDLCDKIAQLMQQRCMVACGEANLMQFAGLLSRCHVVIMNDGGPLHISVAAGARTVSIFGPVDEYVYGPYSADKHIIVKKDIACRPCYRRFRKADCEHISCLKTLEVEDVLQKVEGLL